MKTHGSPLLLLFLLLLQSACSGDDSDDGEDGASPDAAADDGYADAAAPDAAEPPAPDAAIPPGPFTLEGDVVGDDIPADAEVMVAWVVSSTSPDYAYKYGDGSSTGPHFALSLSDAPPPAVALNNYGNGRRLGIGFVVLVPTGSDFPEGVIDPEALNPLGYSRTPIIWREGTFGGGLTWPTAFEEGSYQCGQCVPAAEGETFDGFEPIDCAEVEIEAPPPENDCNFT